MSKETDKCKAKSEYNKAVEVAKTLLNVGVNVDLIAKSTGLTTEEVESIKENL